MSGRWDKIRPEDAVSLSDLFKTMKILNAGDMIEDIAKEGIEQSKLPEDFVMSPEARKDLIKVVENMIDTMRGIDNITDSIMGYLRGYSMGCQTTNDKELDPF